MINITILDTRLASHREFGNPKPLAVEVKYVLDTSKYRLAIIKNVCKICSHKLKNLVDECPHKETYIHELGNSRIGKIQGECQFKLSEQLVKNALEEIEKSASV